MNKFSLRPKRVRQRLKPVKKADQNKQSSQHQNLVKNSCPIRPNIAWVSDFTYLKFKNSFVYLATILDQYTREVVGFNISTSHNRALIIGALTNALKNNNFTLPVYLHSDQGSEYDSQTYTNLLKSFNINISMSKKQSPWENPYQESFYSHFKLDLGSLNKYQTLGELIEAVYLTIDYYNKQRIHTRLKMPPYQFKEKYYKNHNNLVQTKC